MKATTSPVSQWCCHSWPNVNLPNGIDPKMKDCKLNLLADNYLVKWKRQQAQFHNDAVTVCQMSFCQIALTLKWKILSSLCTKISFTSILSQFSKHHSAKWLRSSNKKIANSHCQLINIYSNESDNKPVS